MTIGTEDVCPECGHYAFMCKHAELARIAALEAENATFKEQLDNALKYAGLYKADLAAMTADRDSEQRWACHYHAAEQDAQKELARLREAARWVPYHWIPVQDRLPEGEPGMSDEYIVCDNEYVICAEYHFGDKTWHAGTRRIDGVTHWRELPAPPEPGE
jgi:hypothetical protein